MKISFKNDYSEGAHPAILEALLQTNRQQQPGYGLDDYSEQAKALIRERIGNPQAEIFFVSGGTQANLLVLGHVLRPHESIIACQSAHIADHETGAIEAVGHKIHLAPSDNGKLSPEHIRDYASRYTNVPHQVQPRLVYITQTTEIGTLYSLAELKAIWQCCQELGLLLYMDGARLAQALSAEGNDIGWEDLARYTDIFYIGATKCGALLGEAIVFNQSALAEYFSFYIKQKGALLAKGRLLGLQFLTLFQNNLYEELG
ncbi:aminotransferase class V-fold PLP-dependent enzyme, partial [uncultured Capnocytophaga sp.]|uniref:threonine aldolase family protein n=1 Tax=uncultured Capnocytophaga sp. TaxID=159273 RepID=UPI00263302B6